MPSNIINHKHIAESTFHETKLFIKNKNISTFEKFQTIFEKYGYSLKDDLYVVIQFMIPNQCANIAFDATYQSTAKSYLKPYNVHM